MTDIAAELRQCSREIREAANIMRPNLPALAEIYDAAAARAAKAAEEAAAPPAIVAPPATPEMMEALRAAARRPGHFVVERHREMTLERFLNALRILKSTDLGELQDAGLFADATKPGLRSADAAARDRAVSAWDHWESFRDDPLRYLIGCDDETAGKIWAVVEARQP